MTWNPDMSAAPRDGTPTPEQLIAFGYAPGHYQGPCRDCGTMMYEVDKRAWRCKTCATKLALNAPTHRGSPMKEQELDELVRRLQDHLGHYNASRVINSGLINPDGEQAAAAIQSLREQVKDAQKRIEELEEALRYVESLNPVSADIHGITKEQWRDALYDAQTISARALNTPKEAGDA